MDIEAVKGFAIFTGIVAMYMFVILGCMEKRLRKITQVLDEAKYVN
jgi:hypothetical protein